MLILTAAVASRYSWDSRGRLGSGLWSGLWSWLGYYTNGNSSCSCSRLFRKAWERRRPLLSRCDTWILLTRKHTRNLGKDEVFS